MQTVDAEWVWYHYFPSLEDGIHRYRQLVATGLLHPDAFPVLEFEGEYHVVRCASGVSAHSPVWHVHQNPERVANYLSVTTYMETAAEWYESGAVTATHLRAVPAIHPRHNPGAAFPYAVD